MSLSLRFVSIRIRVIQEEIIVISVTITYPHQPGKKFDYDYYLSKHMPRTIELISSHPDFRGISVERGVSGTAPGSDPAYVAMCHMTFATREGFLESFMPHAPELQADIPNYTDIEPITQFNEIEILESKA